MVTKTFEIAEHYAKIIDKAVTENNIEFSTLVTELLLEWVEDIEVVKAYAKELPEESRTHNEVLKELGLLDSNIKD